MSDTLFDDETESEGEYYGQDKMRRVVKNDIDVEIILSDGSTISGCVFLADGERVSDLFNDPKPFLPFRQPNGEFILLAKRAVALCKPLDRPY